MMSERTTTDLRTLHHSALLYATPGEFADVAGQYVERARGAGEVPVVIAGGEATEALFDRLGTAGTEGVEFIDAAAWFTGPIEALGAFHEHARNDWWPRGPVRLLAEPVWTGRADRDVREWLRHEAVLNVVLAGTPTRLLCAYATSTLPTTLLRDAARTHPLLTDAGGTRDSPGYVEPARFSAECDAEPLVPPPLTAARKVFASGSLPMLREFLAYQALRHGLRDSYGFVLAVNEVATHVIREGGGHGAVWLWREGAELVCDVTDPNASPRDPFLGYFPPHAHRHAESRMWAVRRLCTLVEIRATRPGTRTRLRVRVP
ncbi:MEDS domain-containing protein [Actinomadura flavalba]|uniref:MEDS domain-containing protein n=1 Tax=Actinomadura flavalba TaxID=1120938 RepID=UPI000364A07E|nr:MEDS domain-containing protein [Actinomadura flavalba]